jgi:hypothetical protein
MSSYVSELTNVDADGRGDVVRTIVATKEWAETNLGGVWQETADPYTDEPQVRVYAGAGFHFDPGVPEGFIQDEWDSSKGTTMQPDGDGGFYWFYNTQGQLTWHNGRAWRNLMPSGTPNVWEPGVANWREYPLDGGVPVWVQPTGAVDAYPLGFVVKHNGQTWESLVDNNVWEPSAAVPTLWEDID